MSLKMKFAVAALVLSSSFAGAQTSIKEVQEESKTNPLGVNAYICFATATLVGIHTETANSPVDPTVSRVLEKAMVQGNKAYDDKNIFVLKTMSSMSLMRTVLENLKANDSAEYYSRLAKMRVTLGHCDKTLTP